MAYRLHFTLMGLPKATNQLLGAHRFTKHSNAKLWKKRVFEAIRNMDLPKKPLTKAKITLIRHNYRSLDYDGCVASFKPVVDGLCSIKKNGKVIWPGVLKHDGWSVTGKWDVDQAHAPKGIGYIEVIVEEVK
jgi:hypothetical protein